MVRSYLLTILGIGLLLLAGCTEDDIGDTPEARKKYLEETLSNASWRFSFLTPDQYCNFLVFERQGQVIERSTSTGSDSCYTYNYRWQISTDDIDMDDPDKLGILYLGASRFYISEVDLPNVDMWRRRTINGFERTEYITLVQVSKQKK